MSRFAGTRLAPVVVRTRSLFSLGALEVRRILLWSKYSDAPGNEGALR
jgi:hypothetical protein